MDIRIKDTGEILTEREFKKRHRNTSFAHGIVPESFLDDVGAEFVEEGVRPEGEWWQYPLRDGVEYINGKCHWKYILGPVFSSQEEEDAYISQKNQELHRSHELNVNEERERRILKGATFTVGGKQIYLTGDKTNKDNLSDLAFAALMRQSNSPNHTTIFRDGNNVDHQLKPAEILELWSLAAAYVSNLYHKSWTLKAMENIPEDYTNDSYWS